ncbi:hypothetical protein AURDEDRAFT_164765 [Auricularia subglabra TFB-10046 SS5]|nr:hypothetical protein AURDEDRAFT_164765 [Auricularia subglabra TFB-10046 SS5]
MACAACSRVSESEKVLRCSRCKDAVYCSAECQTADWKKHKRACHPPPDPARNALPSGSEELLERIHGCMAECHEVMDEYMTLLKASGANRSAEPELALAMRSRAEDLLLSLEIPPELAFRPADREPLQQAMLSIVRLLFLESMAGLTAQQKEWMARMLDITPSHGKRVPRFNGKDIVARPGELSARVYEGLFRCLTYLFIQVDGKEEVEGKKWRSVAETLVMLWRED